MKKNILPLLTVLFCSFTFGQVGINTQNPNSTLDVIAKGGNGDRDGFQPPRLTRAQLTSKGNTLYGTNQNGTLIYITDISGGDTAGPRVNIDAIGYYYFNGIAWQKISTNSGANTPVSTVVASGRNTTPTLINDSSGFTQLAYTISTNDGNWNSTDNTYTVSKNGYYQVSMQGKVFVSTSQNSFSWHLIINTSGSDNIAFGSINNNPGGLLSLGGVAILYLNAGSVLRFGVGVCSLCSSNYNILDRYFTLTYLGQ